jgi:CRISPR-associated helicase Cas3/CRISPR-associated endonuclease Cas3-HD
MSSGFYAHSDPAHPDPAEASRYWEPLFSPECPALSGQHCAACETLERMHGHLNKVAWWTAKFAAEIYPDGSDREAARRWGHLAGLWHDLGKFSERWQAYLRTKADIHSDEVIGRMDHSTAGANYAASRSVYGQLMAYAIAGHHAGLADGTRLRARLTQYSTLAEVISPARAAGLPLDLEIPAPPFQKRTTPKENAFGFGSFVRLLFSCLVDADFLATESFMEPTRGAQRPLWPADLLSKMNAVLHRHIDKKQASAPDTLVNRQRKLVREACLEKAALPPGFFSLTVPTGGGKTLASLSFALEHALKHGLRQIVYVIPFTSIIEQNAGEFRSVFEELAKELDRDVVVEHHSNLDPDRETTANRLGAENWDAPLVVTTSVQFFESLYAARTSRCRKLHRLARAVVIFDEAQALPVSLLAPCLATMKSLVRDFGSTLVLCTATQPALKHRKNFEIGLDADEVREIITDPRELFLSLRRTRVEPLGTMPDEALVTHFQAQQADTALFIVNLRRHARALFERLSHLPGTFHLSAQMCPEHRSRVLEEIRKRLDENLPVVLVATRVIEAGVDISFPLVYRAEGGLDSLAQAAGRCNRNGEMRDDTGTPALGRVFAFRSADFPLPPVLKDMQEAASAAGQLEERHRADLLGLAAIEEYFQLHYWQRREQTNGWDQPPGNAPSILSNFELGSSGAELFYSLGFASAAEAFRLIDSPTKPVIIPWGEKGETLWTRLRSGEIGGWAPSRADYRVAQRLTVQIPIGSWEKLNQQGQFHLFAEGALPMLINARLYDERIGLDTDNPTFDGII